MSSLGMNLRTSSHYFPQYNHMGFYQGQKMGCLGKSANKHSCILQVAQLMLNCESQTVSYE